MLFSLDQFTRQDKKTPDSVATIGEPQLPPDSYYSKRFDDLMAAGATDQEKFLAAADEFEKTGGDINSEGGRQSFFQSYKAINMAGTQPINVSDKGIQGALNARNAAAAEVVKASRYDPNALEKKLRARMQNTSDIDDDIDRLEGLRYSTRPELLKKYENILDPNVKESLIRKEESLIDKEIVDLVKLKTQREGAISDIVKDELSMRKMDVEVAKFQYQNANSNYAAAVQEYNRGVASAKDVRAAGEKLQKAQQEADDASQYWNLSDESSPVGAGWQNRITQDYGARTPLSADNVRLANGKIGTPGIDIDGKIGDPIYFATGGTIVGVKNDFNSHKGYGGQIAVEDKDHNIHLYNHLSAINVKVGDTVETGQLGGKMGNSGSVFAGPNGDGSHLDWRVKDPKGQWIDPKQFIGRTANIKQDDILVEAEIDLLASEIGKTEKDRKVWKMRLKYLYEQTGDLEQVKKMIDSITQRNKKKSSRSNFGFSEEDTPAEQNDTSVGGKTFTW